MPEGPKLLLIDGNNMCHRVFWANKDLAYKGKCTGVLYGFFKQLVMLHKTYPDHFRVVVWDSGYARRLAESEAAVAAGIIPSAYKATRVSSMDDGQKESFDVQVGQLRDEGMELTRCIQVRVKGVEADDIINTYAVKNRQWGGESVIISSDQDFYQVLGQGTSIYDAMKQETRTAERFEMEFGLKPEKWVDVGAIAGDKGDNIFGVDGWGPVTACKYVREFGSVDAIMAALRNKKKLGKREQDFLVSEARLKLALSLKRMDIIEGLPKPRICREVNHDALEAFFLRFGFASLLKEIVRLV